MVKAFTATPKSVSSAVLGVVSPFTIETLFPVTSISGKASSPKTTPWFVETYILPLSKNIWFTIPIIPSSKSYLVKVAPPSLETEIIELLTPTKTFTPSL